MSADLKPLDPATYIPLIDLALAEDLGNADPSVDDDITAAWTVPDDARATAAIFTRQAGVVAGLDVALAVFRRLDPALTVDIQKRDGDPLSAEETIVRLSGRARALLTGERTALNFLQRLCGVASLTRTYVDAIAGTAARITDTRKTTPGFRLLEKHAVRAGGGVNHRLGLYDAVLIKENHAASVGGVGAAIRRIREGTQRPVPVFVEAESLEEVRDLIPHRPDRIMLDNMAIAQMAEAVRIICAADPAIAIEATGGITLENVRAVAETGVDLISIGALTHSAPALDLSMLFES